MTHRPTENPGDPQHIRHTWSIVRVRTEYSISGICTTTTTKMPVIMNSELWRNGYILSATIFIFWLDTENTKSNQKLSVQLAESLVFIFSEFVIFQTAFNEKREWKKVNEKWQTIKCTMIYQLNAIQWTIVTFNQLNQCEMMSMLVAALIFFSGAVHKLSICTQAKSYQKWIDPHSRPTV